MSLVNSAYPDIQEIIALMPLEKALDLLNAARDHALERNGGRGHEEAWTERHEISYWSYLKQHARHALPRKERKAK